MIRAKIIKISLFLFATGIILSCLKPKEYPDTPVIEFKSLTEYGDHDSAEVSFTFKDGDGDIGLDEKDTFPPFDPQSRYFKNVYLLYMYKDTVTGTFKPFLKYNKACGGDTTNPGDCDTLFKVYRIQNITPKGQNKVLDGEIKIKLKGPYFEMGKGHKTVKYEIFMFDRALHKSNTVETSEIQTGE